MCVCVCVRLNMEPRYPLTACEYECQRLLFEIQRIWTSPGASKMTPQKFLAVLGQLRNTLTHLDNKERGCATGLHRGACKCQPDTIRTADDFDDHYKR